MWIEFFLDFLVFYSFFMFLLGFVGNIFTYKLYSSPTLNKNTLSLYFRALSISNNYQLLHMLRMTIIVKFNWDMRLYNDGMCKAVDYSQYAVNAVSAWILVIVSIDRFMNIAFPKRLAFLYKRQFQWFLLGLLLTTQPVYYVFMTWSFELINVESIDPLTNETIFTPTCVNNNAWLLSWMDLMNSTIVPFLFMTVTTILLIYFIRKSRNRISNATNMSKERVRDRKFAITSVSLNILFLILNLTPATYNLLAAYVTIQPPDLNFLLTYFIGMVFCTFFAIDFYVQVIANSIVRDQFLLLFGVKLVSVTANGTNASNSLHTNTDKRNHTNQTRLSSVLHTRQLVTDQNRVDVN